MRAAFCVYSFARNALLYHVMAKNTYPCILLSLLYLPFSWWWCAGFCWTLGDRMGPSPFCRRIHIVPPYIYCLYVPCALLRTQYSLYYYAILIACLHGVNYSYIAAGHLFVWYFYSALHTSTAPRLTTATTYMKSVI